MTKDIEYILVDRVLIRKFYGNVLFDDLKSSLVYIIDNKLLNKNMFGVISDYSEAKFLVEYAELLKIKDFFVENANELKHLKFAQIILTPEIVQTMLFENDYTEYFTKAFSTMKAAKKWINS